MVPTPKSRADGNPQTGETRRAERACLACQAVTSPGAPKGAPPCNLHQKGENANGIPKNHPEARRCLPLLWTQKARRLEKRRLRQKRT